VRIKIVGWVLKQWKMKKFLPKIKTRKDGGGGDDESSSSTPKNAATSLRL
jgi:hypothetical protein